MRWMGGSWESGKERKGIAAWPLRLLGAEEVSTQGQLCPTRTAEREGVASGPGLQSVCAWRVLDLGVRVYNKSRLWRNREFNQARKPYLHKALPGKRVGGLMVQQRSDISAVRGRYHEDDLVNRRSVSSKSWLIQVNAKSTAVQVYSTTQ
jgi:hypothetical protein